LQAYAELLGAPLTVVEECAALPEALRSLTDCEPEQRPELVLIDTCGYGPADWARARRLAEVVAARADIDVHLVLSLASKCSDLRRTVERYRVFQPDRLLFTKADETDSHGALLNEMVRSGLPLSYVTNGQRVPEDITPASAAYLTRLLLKNDLMQ
jgi:flagellar biosynthesis protein FlhF